MITHGEGRNGPDNWSRGDWMQTFTGRKFYPMSPRPEDIDPADIAHALSLTCRFGGHVSRFYSVAEHCVLMAQYVWDHGTAPWAELAKWALLHDATEAYVGDMVRPLKVNLPEYQRIEYGVMVAIAERFQLTANDRTPEDFPVLGTPPADVKALDNSILLTERNELLGRHGSWAIEDTDVPLFVRIEGWSPAKAEQNYLRMMRDLGLT